MIEFVKKPITIEIQFPYAGEIHTATVRMRPLQIGELLYLGTLNPVVFSYLTGQTTTALVVKRKVGETEVEDYSNVDVLIDFVFKTVEEIRIDSEILPREKYKDLPDLVVAQMLVHFRNFNFLCQGDVAFFEKMQELLRNLPPMQE